MSWLRRRKLRSYFWVLVVSVSENPLTTHLSYGIAHSRPGESAMSVFNSARDELEKKYPGISGRPLISFTLVPNDL